MYYYSLGEYKSGHEREASLIKGWETMNKNDLVAAYIEHENDPMLANAYMSAIICRYWSNIHKFYLSSRSVVADPTIFYDWLVGGIMRAINKRRWLDPTSSIYGDPNGADKAINRCLKCERLRWFQVNNNLCRKANLQPASIEFLHEEMGDNAPLPVLDGELEYSGNVMVKVLVDKLLDKKEFVSAFVVNGIVNQNVIDVITESEPDEGTEDSVRNSKDTVAIGKNKYIKLNKKRLIRYIYNLSDKDCEIFAFYYNKPLSEVREAKEECAKLSRARLHTAVNKSLRSLQKILAEV